MTEHVLVSLASVLVLGIGAQWLAWHLRLPAILLLLVFGIVAGPVTGLLEPEALLGELLLPIVSLSVAVILFEGGLSLRLDELPQIGGVVRNLLSVGVIVTWLVSAIAARFLLGLETALAVLLGAILVVTGPTVIGPLLLHVRPTARLGSILRWEGIVIDPIGAMLAVLVFEAILLGEVQQAPTRILIGVLKMVVIGGTVGLFGAGLAVQVLKRYWVPDFLQNPVLLMLVVGTFTASNLLQTESGLLTVTVMGVALANQRTVPVRHIIEFKENLRVLLISGLFILLAARLQASNLTSLSGSSLAFLSVLILIARPVSVVLSTVGSQLTWQERAFLAWMAPRGIVAAAVASIFALRLAEAGHAQALLLVPITFEVIIGTVATYGLTAAPVATWLQVAQPNPQGVLIVGAHSWARAIATTLQAKGYTVKVIDTNWANISAARMEGLSTVYANVLSEYVMEQLELAGIGRLLALTPNDEVNTLATLRFAEIFGRSEVYQLTPQSGEHARKDAVPQHFRGRLLFDPRASYADLAQRFVGGAAIKATHLTEEFDYGEFREHYGEAVIPLFLITETGTLTVWTAEQTQTPQPGQTLISLVSQTNLASTEASPLSGRPAEENV